MLTAALPLPALSRLALRLPKLEWRHWLASLVLAIFLALNLLAGLSLVGVQGQGGQAAAKVPANLPAALRAHVPPAPEPLQFREIAPQDAVAFNASIPLSTSPNPAARPFSLVANSEADRLRAIDCLTSAIYYESAIEPIDGQRAVAQVVLNRARHPAYPNTVCGVVFQGSERSTGCQFTFTCDGSLLRTPSLSGWARARRIAAAALAGSVYAPVGHATHYHTVNVLPYWASSLIKSAVIGAHIFYRWNGGWGTPAAFRQAYAGLEPLPGPRPRTQTAIALPSPAILQAELATLLKTGRQAERLAVPATVADPGSQLPEVSYTGVGLPESQVREAYRYSGVPRDELPAGAAGGN